MRVIEKLRNEEIGRAVALFQNGLSMEVPPGSMPNDAIRGELRNTMCLVHKTGSRLDGLVNFRFNRSRNITLMFVCSDRPGRGVGTVLIRSVAELGARNRAEWIYSGVSGRDKRAMSFYLSLGFRSYKRTGHFRHYIRANPNVVIRLVGPKGPPQAGGRAHERRSL